jgi:hypothetical protein
MLSSPKTWLTALALALAFLCTAAPAPAAPAPGAGPARAEADPLVPGDAEMMVVVNIRQMLNAPLVKKYGLEELKAALKKNDEAQKALAAAGLDPFKDVDSLTVTNTGGTTSGKVLVVVRGRYDLDKVHQMAAAHAEKKPDQLKITKVGAVQLYELKGGDNKPAFAAFADKNTLVVSPSKDYTLEAVGKVGQKPAKLNKEMQAALDKITAKDPVWWMAVVVTEEMRKAMAKGPQMAELAPKLESITGSLTLTDAAQLTLQIHTTDAKAAAQFKIVINNFKPLLAVVAQSNEEYGPVLNDVLSNLKVATDKGTVTISLKVTEDMIEKAGKKDK